MRFFGSLIAVLLIAAAAPSSARQPAIAIPGGGSLQVSQRGAMTILAVARNGGVAHATLPAEDGIYADSLGDTQIVGTIPGRVLIISSDYASRPNGGSHQCGAGTETVLRVIAVAPHLKQTFRQLTASCWQTVEQGDISWDARSGTLAIERTTFDSGTQDLRSHYRIAPDGTVTPGEIEQLP